MTCARTLALVLPLCLAVAAAGAADRAAPPAPSAAVQGAAKTSPVGPAVREAVADLRPTAGNQVKGRVTFVREGHGVKAVADIEGLPPNGKHGFHIHEFGDCTAPDGKSAGDHFAPRGHPHGAPDRDPHHAGDLGNVVADGSGRAHVEMTLDDVSLTTGADAIAGRAVIVHAKEDDLRSQPSGNAGDRVACGVIGVTQAGAR
jgi:superoxide dismutase, Cu-Zn family